MKSPSTIASAWLVVAFLGFNGILQGDSPVKEEPGSYLFSKKTGPDNTVSWERENYLPQAGDLLLFNDHNKAVQLLYRIVGSGGPSHSAIIFRRSDGQHALLEAGPDLKQKVFILQVLPRLQSYHGTVLMRRLKTPLTAEQSAKLTDFSQAQEGKPYAMVRLILQGTPFRPRGPLRRNLFGRTMLDRNRWTCCELTGAAATAAGILDPKVHFANCMYPRDFAYDEDFDLSPYYHPPVVWYPWPDLTRTGNTFGIIGGQLKDPSLLQFPNP
jgi:hypothetical protein